MTIAAFVRTTTRRQGCILCHGEIVYGTDAVMVRKADVRDEPVIRYQWICAGCVGVLKVPVAELANGMGHRQS